MPERVTPLLDEEITRLLAALPEPALPEDFTEQVLAALPEAPPRPAFWQRPLVRWIGIGIALALAAGRLSIYLAGIWIAAEALG